MVKQWAVPTKDEKLNKSTVPEDEANRTWVRSAFVSHRRNHHKMHCNQALLKLEGVLSREEAEWYMGKRCQFVQRATSEKKGTLWRSTWGRVVRVHGNSGIVGAKFKKNLPPAAIGSLVRVHLFPMKVTTPIKLFE